ncbi:hypothetical protein TTHERM_00419790 (macronuclear) [Tetrahymena thermophila SB210]|uniref:Uncharacterized protein n=1 Tax=Tetrahymena thermophila (strain SB210) TaxID=312017 RepID=I7M067_TETTS|nr:hypothetical protein TTHERM_00419790 [Tetrahymena thermophila SB210]EAR85576.2 hypothetical protein TTHERM_00419790 [Tetrahymena thermophila SB210]|eukprot:XP_001033239.2 hypothetical protein TTHERM_00419790 [Tetrahymena thermophila SB210]
MKISSLSSIRNFQSQNSMSSMDTIDSPIQIIEKKHSNIKKVSSRPLINSIISKEDLRQVIANESYSCKNSLRRLNSQNLSDNNSSAGVAIKSERNIAVPVRVISQQHLQKHSYQNQAAPLEVFLDSSADEDNHPHVMAPQNYHLSQYANQQSNYYVVNQDNESECDSDSDEHNIWDNSEAQNMGINIENSEVPYEFCQLFYIRSQLYQANRISKTNILDEVQVISNMCKKQMNVLKSSKLIDQLEMNHHISLRKNQMQLSKLKLQKESLSKPIASQEMSQSQKQTPKAFRISQNNLFHTPNKPSKQCSIPNIPEDMTSPIYHQGRHNLTKSTMNLKMASCETLPMKISSPNNNSNNISKINTPTTVRKINLKLNISKNQRPASKLGQERYAAISKHTIYNCLSKAFSHSKFHPLQNEINV